MGSRNTFVTSFIYARTAVEVVDIALRSVVGESSYHFHGSAERDAGYFSGIMKTSGNLPFDEYTKLLNAIDLAFKEIEYTVDFNIAVIGDDEYGVLQRWDRYGEYSSMARQDG